jgi:transglutaminase-like putative cysteine protease
MSHGSDERVAVTAAVASLLATLTLAPLVAGYTWVLVAVIMIVTVMVTGIIARQFLRWWGAVAAVQAVVLLFTLLVLFARSQILSGPAGLALLGNLYADGLGVARDQQPPVESTQGIVLLLAASAGLVALLVDVLAASLRQPALAGLPLLAVYCMPAALLDGGLPWYYFFAAASGFLLLLAADSGDRVRGWGRVLSSSSAFPGAGRTPSDGGMARGGRRVGATVVLVAAVLPAMVPGLNNQIIGGNPQADGNNGKGRTIRRINPILTLRNDLRSTDNTELLTYRTSVTNPEPLRIVTSDVFDGENWSPSTMPIPQVNRAQDGLPPPPGLSTDVRTVTAQTQISIGLLSETYLPLPYPTTKVDAPGTWLYDDKTLNVIGDGQTTQGLTYTVQHLDVQPTAEQLANSEAPPAGVLTQYLSLPTLPGVITRTAHDVAKGGSNYEQAIRLQRWFRRDGNFTYSTDAPTTQPGDSGTDAIVAFLHQKRGYCVHFASTMAVMARILGIPARVAVGFLPGVRRADGTYVISAHDAHAWPELYFQGVGWVRFEPTPRSGLAPPPAWSIPPAGVLPEDPVPSKQPTKVSVAPPSKAPATQAPQRPHNNPARSTSSHGPQLPWRALLIVLAVVGVLASPRLAATVSSRRRWARATSATGQAEAAWDDLRLGLSDLGVRWAAAWTPRAVQRRLAGDDYRLEPDAVAALDRLVFEIEGARYAPPDGDPGRPAVERIQDVATVVSAVATTMPPRKQWLVRLWPPAGLATLARFGPLVNSLTDRAGRRATSLGSHLGSELREKVGSGKR